MKQSVKKRSCIQRVELNSALLRTATQSSTSSQFNNLIYNTYVIIAYVRNT
ncbi:hypothetical protein VTK73DRAFT_4273 [Phialemonium thermophilum]|uniref:Uncharacterized protein n=1 Tax=Phialemonium thermophilum TaxID=223376 RepID=A0ABR3V9Y5_9PEZI